MRDLNLTCHFCGAKCEIQERRQDEFYFYCTDAQCGASGPSRPTPELAAAAHLSVTPVPVWTEGFVPGDGVSFCQDEFGAIGFAGSCQGRIITSPHLGRVVRFARFPFPLDPAEPGEGGGS